MPQKISIFIQAASVGATEDSRVKRSEDSPPDETREIRLEDVRGKKSDCDGICGSVLREDFYLCRYWCWQGNVEWSQPSEGVKKCKLSCRMTPAGCSTLCWTRCYEECDRRFPHKGGINAYRDQRAMIDRRFCKGSCKTEFYRIFD